MSSRTCSKCRQDKPLEAFYRDKSRPLGRAYVCKPCSWTDYRKAYHRKIQKEWRAKNPHKTLAHSVASQYKSKLKKSSCEKCGGTGTLHMHHPDYNKPLEVLTLCVPCHATEHYGAGAVT